MSGLLTVDAFIKTKILRHEFGFQEPLERSRRTNFQKGEWKFSVNEDKSTKKLFTLKISPPNLATIYFNFILQLVHELTFLFLWKESVFQWQFLITYTFSKVWSMLHHGLVGRVQSKKFHFKFTYTFLAFVVVVVVVVVVTFHLKVWIFINFISFLWWSINFL